VLLILGGAATPPEPGVEARRISSCCWGGGPRVGAELARSRGRYADDIPVLAGGGFLGLKAGEVALEFGRV
jgi:hypothetical protein